MLTQKGTLRRVTYLEMKFAFQRNDNCVIESKLLLVE